MYPKDKRNVPCMCFVAFALFLMSWSLATPTASAQTYDFDEGMRALVSGLISKKEALLKNKRIAVFGIVEGSTKEKWRITDYIEDEIVDGLVDEGYTVVERSRIEDVLQNEIKKGTDTWFDEAQVAQFGKLLGADAVVTGRYARWGNTILRVNVRCISVVDGKVLAANKVNLHTDRIESLIEKDIPKQEPILGTFPYKAETPSPKTDWTPAIQKSVQAQAPSQLKKTSLTVSANVTGAQVWVDGKEHKAAPVTVTDLSPGVHIIRIEKEEYEPYEQSVFLKKGTPIELTAILKPTAKTGTIYITGIPKGAEVHVGGHYVGTLPVELKDLLPGSYAVRILQEGYQTYEKILELKSGETAKVDVSLSAIAAVSPQKAPLTDVSFKPPISLTPSVSSPPSSDTHPPMPTSGKMLAASLSLDKKTFVPEERIQVVFSAEADLPDKAWVGLIPATVPHGRARIADQHHLAFYYIRSVKSGMLIFTAPSVAGDYTLRLISPEDDIEMNSVSFNVIKNGQTEVKPTPVVPRPRQEIVPAFPRVLNGAKSGRKYYGYSSGTVVLPNRKGGVLSFIFWNDQRIGFGSTLNKLNIKVGGKAYQVEQYSTSLDHQELYTEAKDWGPGGGARITLTIPSGVAEVSFDHQGSQTGIEISDLLFEPSSGSSGTIGVTEYVNRSKDILTQFPRVLNGAKSGRKYYGYSSGTVVLPNRKGGVLSFIFWNDQRIGFGSTLNKLNIKVGGKAYQVEQYSTSLDHQELYTEAKDWGPGGGARITLTIPSGVAEVSFDHQGSQTGIEISDLLFEPSSGSSGTIGVTEYVNRSKDILTQFPRVLNGAKSGRKYYGYSSGTVVLPNRKGGVLSFLLWNDQKTVSGSTLNKLNIKVGSQSHQVEQYSTPVDIKELYKEFNDWGPAGGSKVDIPIPDGISSVTVGNQGSQTGVELSDFHFRSN